MPVLTNGKRMFCSEQKKVSKLQKMGGEMMALFISFVLGTMFGVTLLSLWACLEAEKLGEDTRANGEGKDNDNE